MNVGLGGCHIWNSTEDDIPVSFRSQSSYQIGAYTISGTIRLVIHSPGGQGLLLIYGTEIDDVDD